VTDATDTDGRIVPLPEGKNFSDRRVRRHCRKKEIGLLRITYLFGPGNLKPTVKARTKPYQLSFDPGAPDPVQVTTPSASDIGTRPSRSE
jgi:hypothetical protein